MSAPSYPAPSTTEASAAQSASRNLPHTHDGHTEHAVHANCASFCSKVDIQRATRAQPYQRKNDDPLYRPLWIFTLDPSAVRRKGAVARVNVPYEPLQPGPRGRLFFIEETYQTASKLRVQEVDLESHQSLLESGRAPSAADSQFHQQMVYAVCSLTYAAFRKALGRDLAWGFDLQQGASHKNSQNVGEDGFVRLRIQPHAFEQKNAYYDRQNGALKFGYYPASSDARGRNIPGKQTFTCLSHDVVAHEITHALLDGLRCHFTMPSNRDVLAFHEGLADMVALFQRFSYREVLHDALREARGDPKKSNLLTGIAIQMAEAGGDYSEALRTALTDTLSGDGSDKKPPLINQYDELVDEPHARGEFLLSTVFAAFLSVFEKKAAPLLRLASEGTGILPEGDLPPDLIEALADKASTIASQFLTICIRAVDYCPPLDIEFGDFLRAVITADHDLVPDDPWGYRDAWIEAFAERGIYPNKVLHMSEDALLWDSPAQGTPPASKLCFHRLAFDQSTGPKAEEDNLKCRADDLIEYLAYPGRREKFGLVEPSLTHPIIEKPCIKSMRSSTRVGPDGQVIFDLVAEVTQRMIIDGPNGHPTRAYGGVTIIIGPAGNIRYAIYKRTGSESRIEQQQQFMQNAGKKYWELRGSHYRPRLNLFQLLEQEK